MLHDCTPHREKCRDCACPQDKHEESCKCPCHAYCDCAPCMVDHPIVVQQDSMMAAKGGLIPESESVPTLLTTEYTLPVGPKEGGNFQNLKRMNRRIGIPIITQEEAAKDLAVGFALEYIPDIVLTEQTCRLFSAKNLCDLEKQGFVHDPINRNYRRKGNRDSHVVVIHPETWQGLTTDQQYGILYGFQNKEAWCAALQQLLLGHLEITGHLEKVMDFNLTRPQSGRIGPNPCSEIDPQPDELTRQIAATVVLGPLSLHPKEIIKRAKVVAFAAHLGKALDHLATKSQEIAAEITIQCNSEVIKNRIAAAIAQVLVESEIKFQAGNRRGKLRIVSDLDMSLDYSPTDPNQEARAARLLHKIQEGTIPLDAVQPNPFGQKEYTTEQIKAMADSIQRQGLWKPINVTEDGTLLDGQLRLLAWKLLHGCPIPCYYMLGMMDKVRRLRAIEADLKAGKITRQAAKNVRFGILYGG